MLPCSRAPAAAAPNRHGHPRARHSISSGVCDLTHTREGLSVPSLPSRRRGLSRYGARARCGRAGAALPTLRPRRPTLQCQPTRYLRATFASPPPPGSLASASGSHPTNSLGSFPSVTRHYASGARHAPEAGAQPEAVFLGILASRQAARAAPALYGNHRDPRRWRINTGTAAAVAPWGTWRRWCWITAPTTPRSATATRT